jgi:hypothetical protein
MKLVLLAALIAATSGQLIKWRLSFDGYGPIRVGMTVAEALKAAKLTLEEDEPPPGVARGGACYYVENLAKLPGVTFMVEDGKITRIEAGSPIVAPGGGREGMTEAQIKKLYPGIGVEPHHYVDEGHYLIQPSPDGRFSLLFETDGKVVVAFRVGYPTPVAYVEGCQ